MSTWRFFSAIKVSAVLRWSVCALREKTLHVRLATTTISRKGPLYDQHHSIAFIVFFLIFFLVFCLDDGLHKDIWTAYHGCSEQTQNMEDVGAMNNTNRPSSLCYGSFCRTHRTAAGTRRRPTPASPPSLSPDRSTTLKQQNNDLLLTKKSTGDVTGALLKSWEIFNFEVLKCSERLHKKGGAIRKMMMGAALPSNRRSLLTENKKRRWHVDTGPTSASYTPDFMAPFELNFPF